MTTFDEAARRPRLARSTAIFALVTGISRVLGLVREIVAAYYFGVAGSINAFTVAFQIPNLVRALVADAAVSSAFVPIFSDLLEKGERRRAWRVASSLFWIMLLGLTGLTALFMVAAPWLLAPFHPANLALTVGLSRVLFPMVALLGVSGIVVGILNCYDEFTIPALTPVVWNLVIIAGLTLGVPNAKTSSGEVYVYAVSVLFATVVQVLLPFPWLRGLDDRLRLVIDWRDPAVGQTLKLMLPVTLGLGLINFNALVDTFFSSRLLNPQLAPAAIDKAFRIYMLPQGMFSVAVATVLFPTLSRLAARQDMGGFRDTVLLGLRQIAFLLIPASFVFAVLATPIVRLLYQHGRFDPAQTTVVAGALAAFSLGLFFNGAMLMLNRAFFSLQSNWIPTTVALANLLLNGVLDAVFYHFGIWGIPLSTAVVNIAGSAALLILLRRQLHGLRIAETAMAIGRILLASSAVAVVAYGVWEPLDSTLGHSLPAQICSLLIALAVSLVVYLGASRLLRIRELGPLLSMARGLAGR